ncbi:MAG: hypothetical protein WBV95_21515 [Desulfobacterales bacterium]
MAGPKDPQHHKMEALIAKADQCGLYGQRYNESETLEELVKWIGEAVCISAFRIVKAVKPVRIEKLAKAFKWVASAKYDSFRQMRINLFAEAIIYVADKLRDALRSWVLVPYPELIADQSIFKGAETFSNITNMSEAEKKKFFAAMSAKMIVHLDNPPKDAADAVSRIVAELGKESDDKLAVNLLESSVINNPLDLIEPHNFAIKFQRLLS